MNFDKPLLAHYGINCFEEGEPPCGVDSTFWLGECLPDCVDGECPEGDCVWGVCVPDIDCTSNCDCPVGFYCNGNTCEALEDIDGCSSSDGDCQCPPGLICVNNTCVIDTPNEPECSSSNPCLPSSTRFCKYGECIDCPDITIDYCWNDIGCGDDEDCFLEIYVSSSIRGVAEIQILDEGEILQTHHKYIDKFPTRFSEKVIGCSVSSTPMFFTTTVKFETCKSEEKSLEAELGIICNDCGMRGTSQQNADEDIISSANEYVNPRSQQSNNLDEIEIFPNPFYDILNLEYDAFEEGKLEIVISDAIGRIILKEFRNVHPGHNNHKFDFGHNLETGVYILNIKNNNGHEKVFKLLHMK